MKQPWRLAIGAAIAIAPPAAAQRDVRADGDWTHAATGMVFPEHSGAAQRTRIHEYDADGADVSAGYAIRRGAAVAFVTVYVYPAPQGRDCAANFDEMSKSVAQSYQDVRLLAVDRWPSPSGRTPGVAYHARFALTGTLDGKDQPQQSESYLFCPAGGHWLVAARASWPLADNFAPAVAEFLHALPWPDLLDAPPSDEGK